MTSVPDLCFFSSKEMAVPSSLKTVLREWRGWMRKARSLIGLRTLITLLLWLNRWAFSGFSC